VRRLSLNEQEIVELQTILLKELKDLSIQTHTYESNPFIARVIKERQVLLTRLLMRTS
jgi:hypothetical protein